MLVQPITNLNNYQTKNCNIAKKHNSTNYATNTMILPSFIDAKSYANINFKAKIHDYARNGDLEGVKRELQKGVDLNIQDEDGWSPLHLACSIGYIDIVKLLCEQKSIDVNIQNKNGYTPLHKACREGYIDIIKLLCEQKGINVNIQKQDGDTPLHWACCWNHTDVIKLLCERDDIDFTVKNNDGETAIDLVRDNGYQNEDWFKELKEKTKYQLAHPETIGKSKPLTKDEEQKLEEQKEQEELEEQEDFKQTHDDEYNTKLQILKKLIQQNGMFPDGVDNIKNYLDKIAVNQIRAEEHAKFKQELETARQNDKQELQAKKDELTKEQQKAQQAVQAKMEELQQQQQELDKEKQTFDELITTHQRLLEQEVSMAQSGFRALYGIQGEPIENLGYPEQLVLVTENLLKNKDKLQNTNENTPDDVTKALRNKDGQISNESLTFLDRILQSISKINANDLIDSINAVKNETGFIDLGKVSLFLSTLAWGTAIKKVIEKVKNMPKIK